MTKKTNVQSKTELLTLSNKLGDELVLIEGEINTIKAKLDSVSNYDGLNFEGAASVIKANLANVLTAMTSLSSNISSYVTKLNEFDQYENQVLDDELIAPELTLPDTPGIAPVKDEDKTENKEPEENVLEEEKNEEDKSDNTPPVTTTPPPSDVKPENEQTDIAIPTPPSDEKPEDKNDDKEDNKPNDNPTPSPSKPTPSNPTPTPQPEPTQNPKFNPEELDAQAPVVVGTGNVNVDVSKFTNNQELGYVVTTGNTSFELGEEDFNLLCAIIEAESDGTYDGTLAVASAVLNRCENAEYLQLHGMDPIAQITALDQFEGYTTGEFQQYLNKNSDIVVEAVKAALAGVRNHTLCTYN